MRGLQHTGRPRHFTLTNATALDRRGADTCQIDCPSRTLALPSRDSCRNMDLRLSGAGSFVVRTELIAARTWRRVVGLRWLESSAPLLVGIR